MSLGVCFTSHLHLYLLTPIIVETWIDQSINQSIVKLCLWVFALAPTCLYLLALTSTWSDQAINYWNMTFFSIIPNCLFIFLPSFAINLKSGLTLPSITLYGHFILDGVQSLLLFLLQYDKISMYCSLVDIHTCWYKFIIQQRFWIVSDSPLYRIVSSTHAVSQAIRHWVPQWFRKMNWGWINDHGSISR